MDISFIDKRWRIEKIEWTNLDGERPRTAGCNARLGVHGKNIKLPLARITINGISGFGWSMVSKEKAEAFIGKSMESIFSDEGRINQEYYPVEFPLLDWMGNITGKPVYSIVSSLCPAEDKKVQTVGCYDTSLYFDDLHLQDDGAAVELMQSEAMEGLKRGHRSFKMKVGRGALHMPLMEGIRRDIEIIRGVRKVAGPDAKLMIDANNGYNMNIAKQVLEATAQERLYWIEEAFHEDPVLYRELKTWLQKNDMQVLIADGEGTAAPPLVDWAMEGLIDVVQYDMRRYGFCKWLELGAKLDSNNIKTAPHNYGGNYGSYATCHLVSAVKSLDFVEWDESIVQGLDASAYAVEDGRVKVPAQPGFALKLDDRWFDREVAEKGWIAEL